MSKGQPLSIANNMLVKNDSSILCIAIAVTLHRSTSWYFLKHFTSK